MLRINTRAGVAAGVLPIAVAAAGAAAAAASPDPTPTFKVSDRTPAPGQRVALTGKAQTSFGRTLTLEYAPAGTDTFRPLATTKVGHGDRFRVSGKPPASGTLRVTVVPNTKTDAVVSREVGVRVVRGLHIGGRRLHVRAGRAIVVKGSGAPGQSVRLQGYRAGSWRTLDKTVVRGGGKFTARSVPRTPMSVPARVVAGGNRRKVGRLNVYRYAQASWYGPGLYGNHLGCGGTLTPGTLGVANKSLPCGSKVTLRHGSHTVRVRVIDRGPYVGNREFDLTAATAQKLHFSGTGAILTTR